jgi:hypothetical protein
MAGLDGDGGRKRNGAQRNEASAKRNETKRNGRLRFGPDKSLICFVWRNRPLRRLLSFQRVEPASRREACFAAQQRRRAADATAFGPNEL